MKLSDARRWVRYWSAAKMISVDAIKTIDDAAQTIRFCKCMRVGVASDLSPATLFNAVTLEFPRT